MSLDKNGAQIKYGPVKGEDTGPKLSFPMGGSEIIPLGGAFVKTDGAGYADIAGDGDALLLGYVFPTEKGLDSGKTYETTNATDGVDVAPFIPISSMLGVVVRMRIDSGTFVAAMRGQTCDLIIQAGKYQAVSLDQSAEDVVQIVDGDLINNKWVDVIPYVAKITGLTGVV